MIPLNTPYLPAIALCTLLASYTFPVAAQGAAEAEFELSDSLSNKLSMLSEAQLEFLESDAPLKVVASREKLVLALEQREPEEVERYVTDMMVTVKAFAYRPGIDMGEVPLNREADSFNGWNVVRPAALWERRRAPGPVTLNRYFENKYGIPTFAGAPVAVTPEDLLAGKVEVAIAGIPQSMSSGNRDARNGPKALRITHGIADRNVFSMLDPGAVLNIVDYGDFAVDRMSLERSVDHVHDMVLDLASTGAVPFLVGGDHSVIYPAVKAVSEVHGEQPLTVVHFGAHYNGEPATAHTISDRNAVYRLLSEGLIDGSYLIQIGLRGSMATPEAFQRMRDLGVRYHTMAEVERNGWKSVMDRILEEVKAADNPVYISFDVSVLDPSELPAAGRAVPGGLVVREVMPLLRRLCAESSIAGFELMDLAPMLDLSYKSALNANYMMNACLSGMAMRKQGIAQEHFLSPLAVDHGQDD